MHREMSCDVVRFEEMRRGPLRGFKQASPQKKDSDQWSETPTRKAHRSSPVVGNAAGGKGVSDGLSGSKRSGSLR